MIGYLTGKLISEEDQNILLDVGGVGYEIFVGTARELKPGKVGTPLSVWVYTYVREDQITLYGFKEKIQKKIFLVLTGINGIGPKLAMAVLNQLSPGELVDAITMGNTRLLRGIQGVGPKMAERMVLELKDKLGTLVKTHEWADTGTNSEAHTWQELSEALTGLGFSDTQIRNVIRLIRKELEGETPDINQLLKSALQKIRNC